LGLIFCFVTSYKGFFAERLERLRSGVITLLDSSKIGPSINDRSSGVIFIGASYPWGTLSPEAQVLQSTLYNEYKKLAEIGKSFLSDRALPQNKDRFIRECDPILELTKQEHCTWYKNIGEAKKALNESFNKQVEAVNSMHGKLGSGMVLIPDTNVIIRSPHFHMYKVKEKCTILMQPTVLAELDSLKVFHRNENVRKKVSAAIKELKYLRSKGQIADGVKVTENVTVCARAIEPRFDNKPSWLDPQNKDDRFLASCFEVSSEFPDSEISILTLDFNVQNKAEISLLPFIDPEEQGII
jgi:hypothetical protein